MFSFSQPELELVVDASSYIFEQGAYHNISDTALASNLQQAGLEHPQALAFAHVWKGHKDDFFSRLGEHTLGAPHVLESIDWVLQMSTGQQNLEKMKELNAVFEFGLGSASNSVKEDKLTVEFDHESLQKFYNQLETIQSQLDGLSSQ